MKKILILSACFLISSTVFSQNLAPEKVPALITKSFTKNFPAARDVRYSKEDQLYRIGFLTGEKQCFATLDQAGKLLETERAIDASQLPAEVRTAVSKNFNGYAIVDAVKREAANAGVCYEMDLKKDRAGFQVRFSPKGNILMKVARQEEIKVTTR
jgi:hypothetical protein